MKNTTTYLREFATEAEAEVCMVARNARVKNLRPGIVHCVVAGPEDNFAVVDLASAIELGVPYRWAL